MKTIITLLLFTVAATTFAQTDLRSVLLDQLKSTHNKSNWFVAANIAVDGVTAEQAAWKDKGNHSVGQLTHHIVFWNERVLMDLNGKKPADFTGKNDETFDSFDKKAWADVVKRLDAVMTGIEKVVQEADEEKLKKIAGTIANVSAHNAYHTGQIIVVRKQQGSWDPAKGVN
jgi:uncharacterized damage-inducible protein DinB